MAKKFYWRTAPTGTEGVNTVYIHELGSNEFGDGTRQNPTKHSTIGMSMARHLSWCASAHLPAHCLQVTTQPPSRATTTEPLPLTVKDYTVLMDSACKTCESSTPVSKASLTAPTLVWGVLTLLTMWALLSAWAGWLPLSVS